MRRMSQRRKDWWTSASKGSREEALRHEDAVDVLSPASRWLRAS
jgi:hypothetical protein